MGKENNFIQRWKLSAKEFTKLRVVVFCGMMGALAVVLSFVASIRIGPYMRIGFSELPNVTVDFLFGPFVGVIFGAVMDVVKYVVAPEGGFFPGFTVSAMIGAAVFGSLLYKRKLTLVRIFIGELITKVFVNMLLNTLWLSMLYGKGFFVLLPNRIILNLVALVTDTIVIYLVLKALDKTIRKEFAKE